MIPSMRHVRDVLGFVETPFETGQTSITNLDEKCIQPNAVDLRVGQIFKIDSKDGVFAIGENGKTHCAETEVLPQMVELDFNDGKKTEAYVLDRGYYRVVLDHKITVGENEAGWTIPRSSLIRNGVIVHSALYDSGYEGSMVCGMSVNCNKAIIEKHSRIAQYICVDAESVFMYNGSYQNK